MKIEGVAGLKSVVEVLVSASSRAAKQTTHHHSDPTPLSPPSHVHSNQCQPSVPSPAPVPTL